jgi:hypothetical protein
MICLGKYSATAVLADSRFHPRFPIDEFHSIPTAETSVEESFSLLLLRGKNSAV